MDSVETGRFSSELTNSGQSGTVPDTSQIYDRENQEHMEDCS